ncbi:MAG: hypothetical protein JSV90_04130 [Methanobacteriota archaeon]|nr:MAG: hypothetical protein JSV90_04130 [Euryarchaeota archaeon]
MAKAESKDADWFAALDEELEKKTLEVTDNTVEQNTQKVAVNRSLLEDFFRIWSRFNKINVHYSMAPENSTFAQFVVYPEEWNFKPDFDFLGVDNVALTDRTQGRVGDSIKAWYYSIDSKMHIRMVFEYCEGEHYYKYAGWKRIFSQYVLLDVPVGKFDLKKYHEMLANTVKVWYESHLRKDRDIILKHIRDKYEKGETFTQ